MNTDKIASAKYAIKVQPIIAPIDIAINVLIGFIPINLPTIEPTKPPDPWNGTITNKTIPINLRGLIHPYLSEELFPIFSTLIINAPINGIFFAKS